MKMENFNLIVIRRVFIILSSTLFLFIVSASVLKSQDQYLIRDSDGLGKWKLNNSLFLEQLFYPGDSFENLKPLGDNFSKECVQSPVDFTCIFDYGNFKLTFKNINGENELYEILINGQNSTLSKNDVQLSPNKIMSRNENSFLQELSDSKKFTETEKFNGGYHYVELFVEDDSFKKVILRRKLH